MEENQKTSNYSNTQHMKQNLKLPFMYRRPNIGSNYVVWGETSLFFDLEGDEMGEKTGSVVARYDRGSNALDDDDDVFFFPLNEIAVGVARFGWNERVFRTIRDSLTYFLKKKSS